MLLLDVECMAGTGSLLLTFDAHLCPMLFSSLMPLNTLASTNLSICLSISFVVDLCPRSPSPTQAFLQAYGMLMSEAAGKGVQLHELRQHKTSIHLHCLLTLALPTLPCTCVFPGL